MRRWKAVLTRFTIMLRNRIALNRYQTRTHQQSDVRRGGLLGPFADGSWARGAHQPYGVIHLRYSP